MQYLSIDKNKRIGRGEKLEKRRRDFLQIGWAGIIFGIAFDFHRTNLKIEKEEHGNVGQFRTRKKFEKS